jgi:hypothetical protein
MMQRVKVKLGLFIIFFLLVLFPFMIVTGGMDNYGVSHDNPTEKNAAGKVTINYQGYFLEKKTEKYTDSFVIRDVQKIENLINKIRQLNTPRELFSKAINEKINKDIVESIVHELKRGGIPEITNRWRLLDLFHHFTKHMLPYQFKTSKQTQSFIDDFLFNINCKVILFGRITDVTMEPENLMGFKTPWYLRYREHLKPGTLIVYDGLFKNDMICGDFLMTGRWFRGFYINIGFPNNYLDLSIGWTAYVTARQLS